MDHDLAVAAQVGGQRAEQVRRLGKPSYQNNFLYSYQCPMFGRLSGEKWSYIYSFPARLEPCCLNLLIYELRDLYDYRAYEAKHVRSGQHVSTRGKACREQKHTQ